MKKRIMLKISGEQLGSAKNNFDIEQANKLCQIIEALSNKGFIVACVMGGGNVIRGRELAEVNSDGTADYMGLLATNQNGLFLNHILNQRGIIKSQLFSNVPVAGLIEKIDYSKIKQHLQAGKVVLLAGGIGKPGFSTDSGVINAAVDLGCQTVVKATKVDGVYNKDPMKYPDAIRYERLTHQEVMDNPEIKVMDREALKIAASHKIKIAVCKAQPEAVIAILQGDTKQGTIIS